MTTLTIRNLDADLKALLRARAARNGRSMESELRHILSDTLAPEPRPAADLADAIRRRFAPLGGVSLEPHPPVMVPKSLSFDE